MEILSKVSVVQKGNQVFIGVMQHFDQNTVILLKARDMSEAKASASLISCKGLAPSDMNYASEEMDEMLIFGPDLAISPPEKIRKNIAELFGYPIAPNE